MIDINRLEDRQALWEECLRFHGHACEGLAIGFQAVMLAIGALELCGQESVVCVSESFDCAVDAAQALLGCTTGKQTLHIRPRGKHALSFYNPDNGKSFRIVRKPIPILPHDGLVDYLIGAKATDLFDIQPVLGNPPETAEERPSHPCEICGEPTQEPYLRIQSGIMVCLDCLNAP